MSVLVLEGGRIFDGTGPELIENASVVIEAGTIKDVTTAPVTLDADRIDLGGRTLLPGLIDAHVHAWVTEVNSARSSEESTEYVAAYAVAALCASLDRGFTTVRDCGGTAPAMKRVFSKGLFHGPRVYPSGRVMSQTGGHADRRHPDAFACGCGNDRFAAIVDSPDAMRYAVREELRRGATQIKIMGSGGVSSPADPIDHVQFTDDEIRVAVEEAQRSHTYVTAHCHPTAAIRRCVELGVRCIEHGTLIDDETAALVARHGAAIVPTLAIVELLHQHGEALGLPAASMHKLALIREPYQASLERMKRANILLGFGTDLLGSLQAEERAEFEMRREIFTPLEILRQATSNNAQIMGESGRLGCIAPGAHADLICVEGDPLRDIAVLGRDAGKFPLIISRGRVHHRAL